MAILDQLKITNASPRKDISPISRFRRRLVESVELQIEMAKAESSGQTLNRTRKRWVKTGNGEEKELRQVPVRLRRWWWKDERGTTFFTLKYGAAPLDLEPGKSVIEIGLFDELPAKLSLICDAIRSGELDKCAPPFIAGGAIAKTAKVETSAPKAPRAKS